MYQFSIFVQFPTLALGLHHYHNGSGCYSQLCRTAFLSDMQYDYSTGTAKQLPLQVVPQGIESVNGSDVNMGCAKPVVNLPGNLTICGSFGSGDGAISYLLDGNSPAIDTSTSDWASQLVTVRKNDGTLDIQDHVLLTFLFDTAVSPTSIELDLFLCPEWNIGASYVFVYADNSSNLAYNHFSNFIRSYTPDNISCDSLSTISISDQIEHFSYRNWHIIVTFISQPDIEWLHVGEVRFLGTDVDSIPIPTSADVPVTPRCE